MNKMAPALRKKRGLIEPQHALQTLKAKKQHSLQTKSRQKRASATDLYKTCKAAGTCPPDVINKIEQNTVADKILKYGSLGVFLGGLGIGTSSGTGGRTGYVPLTAGNTKALPSNRILLPKPPISASDVISVGPSDSSIVPLLEGSAIELQPLPKAPDVTITGESPSTIPRDTPPAVLDVNTPIRPSKPSVTHFSNPLFHPTPSSAELGESSNTSHFFINAIIQPTPKPIEEIPLEPLTSTPINTITRGATALKFFTKDTAQVELSDPYFLAQPKDLLNYTNPAYNDLNFTDSIDFDPEDAAALSDPNFLDIIKLHRPALTETKTRSIRLNRLGLKQGTVQTRKGTKINKKVHFFHNFSPIADDIELQTFSVNNTENVGSSTFSVYNTENVDTENNILNENTYTANNNPYFTSNTLTTTVTDYTGQPFTILGTNTIVTPTHQSVITTTSIPITPLFPNTNLPPVFTHLANFYLHPSLLKKKIKPSFYPFLPDGIVAT